MIKYCILFRLVMECKECGTNTDREAIDNGICFDCYSRLDLVAYEEHQKKNSDEEEQACILPTPSHLGEIVITAGLWTAGVSCEYCLYDLW